MSEALVSGVSFLIFSPRSALLKISLWLIFVTVFTVNAQLMNIGFIDSRFSADTPAV